MLREGVLLRCTSNEAIDGALVRFACVGVADAGFEEIGVGVLGVAAGILDDQRRDSARPWSRA